jgi:hypothetical protein
MSRHLREYLRGPSSSFLDALTKSTQGHEAMAVNEAIEALREEAMARRIGLGRMLSDSDRDRLIAAVRAQDIEMAREVLRQEGEPAFFEWLEGKLSYHVPYRTLSDAALVAWHRFNRDPQ